MSRWLVLSDLNLAGFEGFACGTAAVITPVGRLRWRGGELPIDDGDTIGPVVTEFRECLLDIQYGRVADNLGWVHRLGMSLPRRGL